MYCVAIDPGASGGIAEINTDRMMISVMKMPESTKEILQALKKYKYANSMILLEKQQARPSRWDSVIDAKTQKPKKVPIAAGASSAWSFAQHYGELRGILEALELTVIEYRPQEWMKLAGIRRKNKGESQTDWKNFLKSKAQQMYPGTKVTLAVADALIMADLCHRLYGRTSKKEEDPYADI